MAPRKGAGVTKGKQPAPKRAGSVPAQSRQPPPKRPVRVPFPAPVGGFGHSGSETGTSGAPGAGVPAGPSNVVQPRPAPGALPGGLTPAVMDAFWDTPVSRAILDRLAGIERRLDGSAASAQNDMFSLELFQAEVLHRLDAIEQRSTGASSSAVLAATDDSRPSQMEVALAVGRGGAQQEVVPEVPVHG
ncbi:UNVERIFIED_CONTAM: hypothetical protein K2H54_035627, partial [Gekko kuhli]